MSIQKPSSSPSVYTRSSSHVTRQYWLLEVEAPQRREMVFSEVKVPEDGKSPETKGHLRHLSSNQRGTFACTAVRVAAMATADSTRWSALRVDMC